MNSQKKIKLIAIAKDEAAYIPQWVFHHLYFGFDAVEIWVNNTTDNSVELLHKLQENYGDEVVSIIESDEFLKDCIENNRYFQPAAYNHAYQRETERGVYTHLMFIDMDELWTPLNFQDSIKDVLGRYPETDVISFLWMVDLPDGKRGAFERPFYLENKFQKNKHVKSLVKISPKIRSIGIHNHYLHQGGILHLGDGSPIEPAEDVLKVNGAYLSEKQIQQRLSKLEDYFIVHQVYRSQEEYLSSLLRGRQHANDKNIFKVNRPGYVPFHGESHTANIQIPADKLKNYDAGYQRFMEENQLTPYLDVARSFIVNRYETAVSMLSGTPSLLGRYRLPLRGLKIVEAIFGKDPLQGAVETVSAYPATAVLEIKGWASDILHNRPLKFQCLAAAGKLVDVAAQKIVRLDLNEHKPEFGIACGFRLEMPFDLVRTIKMDPDESSFNLIVKTRDEKVQINLGIDVSKFSDLLKGTFSAELIDFRGEIRSIEREGDELRFRGQIVCSTEISLSLYMTANDLLLEVPFKKDVVVQEGAYNVIDFTAPISTISTPPVFLKKLPGFFAVANGHAFQLGQSPTYSFPVNPELVISSQPAVTIKASMPKQEQDYLRSLLSPDVKSYIAYGAHDVSIMALAAGVESVIAVDSDAKVLDAFRSKGESMMDKTKQGLHPILVNIGQTKELGYPIDTSNWRGYPLYALLPWELCEEKGLAPDVVLIDARFRVACFLVALAMAKPGAFLLFDDYLDRPPYHVVEQLLKPVEIHGRLAKFVVPEIVDYRVLTQLLLRHCNNSF